MTTPTNAAPGTNAKLEVLRERASDGLPLFVAGDLVVERASTSSSHRHQRRSDTVAIASQALSQKLCRLRVARVNGGLSERNRAMELVQQESSRESSGQIAKAIRKRVYLEQVDHLQSIEQERQRILVIIIEEGFRIRDQSAAFAWARRLLKLYLDQSHPPMPENERREWQQLIRTQLW